MIFTCSGRTRNILRLCFPQLNIKAEKFLCAQEEDWNPQLTGVPSLSLVVSGSVCWCQVCVGVCTYTVCAMCVVPRLRGNLWCNTSAHWQKHLGFITCLVSAHYHIFHDRYVKLCDLISSHKPPFMTLDVRQSLYDWTISPPSSVLHVTFIKSALSLLQRMGPQKEENIFRKEKYDWDQSQLE